MSVSQDNVNVAKQKPEYLDFDGYDPTGTLVDSIKSFCNDEILIMLDHEDYEDLRPNANKKFRWLPPGGKLNADYREFVPTTFAIRHHNVPALDYLTKQKIDPKTKSQSHSFNQLGCCIRRCGNIKLCSKY